MKGTKRGSSGCYPAMLREYIYWQSKEMLHLAFVARCADSAAGEVWYEDKVQAMEI